MKKQKKLINTVIVIALLITAMVFSSCFMGGISGNMVSPEIRAIGLPSTSDVGSVTLKVSGPNMDTIEVNYSQLPSMINISIPEGNDRIFELTVGLSETFIALDPGVITSYKGTATVDLNTDGAIVTLNMGVGSTKIVVPDYQNNSMLQFDDISDTIPTSLDVTTNALFGIWLGLRTFYPYDIDFDSQGRIYIANYGSGSDSGIIRVDNIIGTNPYFINTSGFTYSITIDRENDILYFVDGSDVFSTDLDGNNLEVQTDILIEAIDGLTFDNGFLYTAEMGTINKYDISTKTIVDFAIISELGFPEDLMVKGDKLYVANMGGVDGDQILELSTSDLSLTGSYGNYVGDSDSSNLLADNFYGPRRFVAQMNDEITIIDDSPDWWINKIIQMDNILGENWTTFPTAGSTDDTGQLFFKFFDNNNGV